LKLFASATRDNASGETILKVVNGENQPSAVKLELAGAKTIGAAASVSTLANADPQAENTFGDPDKISPQTTTVTVGGPEFNYTFPANSFTALRLKAN